MDHTIGVYGIHFQWVCIVAIPASMVKHYKKNFPNTGTASCTLQCKETEKSRTTGPINRKDKVF